MEPGEKVASSPGLPRLLIVASDLKVRPRSKACRGRGLGIRLGVEDIFITSSKSLAKNYFAHLRQRCVITFKSYQLDREYSYYDLR